VAKEVSASASARDGSADAGSARTPATAATAASGAAAAALPSRRHDATVRSFAPGLFRTLRKEYGVSSADFVASVRALRASKRSEGKSGAFMFTTSDQRFIVKTLTQAEFKFFLRIVSDYVAHLVHCNQYAPPAKDDAGAEELGAMRRTLRKRGDFIASDVYTPPAESAAGASSGASASQGEGGVGVGGKGTLLSKIFGAYSIQMYWHTEYFCVMENAFPPKGACLICSPFSSLYFTVLFFLLSHSPFMPKRFSSSGSIQEMYDLKGSKTDRSATRLKDGAIAMCKFCEQRFVVGGAAEKNCPFRVRHEGVQLLKVRTARTTAHFSLRCDCPRPHI
jgi:hypothetical protein